MIKNHANFNVVRTADLLPKIKQKGLTKVTFEIEKENYSSLNVILFKEDELSGFYQIIANYQVGKNENEASYEEHLSQTIKKKLHINEETNLEAYWREVETLSLEVSSEDDDETIMHDEAKETRFFQLQSKEMEEEDLAARRKLLWTDENRREEEDRNKKMIERKNKRSQAHKMFQQNLREMLAKSDHKKEPKTKMEINENVDKMILKKYYKEAFPTKTVHNLMTFGGSYQFPQREIG